MNKWLIAFISITASSALIGVCREVFGFGFWTAMFVTWIPNYLIVGWAMDAFGFASWVTVYRAKRSARIIEGDKP